MATSPLRSVTASSAKERTPGRSHLRSLLLQHLPHQPVIVRDQNLKRSFNRCLARRSTRQWSTMARIVGSRFALRRDLEPKDKGRTLSAGDALERYLPL